MMITSELSYTEQTINYLKAFQKLKDKFYIRCLPGKEDPLTKENLYSQVKAYKVKSPSNKDYWVESEFVHLQKILDKEVKKGRVPYLNYNNGGTTKEQINECTCLAAEFDLKHGWTKESMMQQVNSKLEDLTPNIIVETRNGYHFYWLFDKVLDKTTWEDLSKRLVLYLDSDPCTATDIARVLRIPGFPHLQTNTENYITTLYYCNTNYNYNLISFDCVLPPLPKTLKVSEEERELASNKYREELLASGLDWQDTRELAKNLPGFRIKNESLFTCTCPAHGLDGNSHSNNSLTIRRDNGAFQCFAGCEPNAIYKALCKFANANLYRIVDREKLIFTPEEPTKKTLVETDQELKEDDDLDKSKNLLITILNLFEQSGKDDYKNYDRDWWLKQDTSSCLSALVKELQSDLRQDIFNGHTEEAKTLLQEYVNYTGDHLEVEVTQYKEGDDKEINLRKNQVSFNDLDRDLLDLLKKDKDVAELKIDLGNLTQKHYGNRNNTNLNYVEERYEELFEQSLEEDALTIGQQIREQAKSIPKLDYSAAFEFSPLLTEIYQYCNHHNIPLTHSFVSFLVASTALLPSNLEMVYSKLHSTIPTIFMLLVSESTAGKDLITDTFFKPLASMHHANENENEEIEKENEDLKEAWLEEKKVVRGLEKPHYTPLKRKYIIKDANIDSRKADLAANKGHRLLEQDSEYTTLIKGIKDRHSKTGSSGIEDELIRIYNGEQFSDSRVTKKGSRGTYALSIMSNTQFERVPEAIDMDNKSGLTSRLTMLAFKGYIEIEDEYMGPEDSGENSSLLLMSKIRNFYKLLEVFWQGYENSKEFSDTNLIYMHPEAFQLMKAWIIGINRKSLQTQHKGFRQWLRRVRQNATRFCMIWHCIKQALGSSDGEPGLVSSITVMETIQLMEELIPMSEELFRIGVSETIPTTKKDLIQKILDKQSRLNRPITIRDIKDFGEFRKTHGASKTAKSSELHAFLKSMADDYQLGTYDKKLGFSPF